MHDLVGDEFLAGFVSLGSLVEAPPRNKEVRPDAVRSRWMPRAPFTRSKPAGLDVAGGPGREGPALAALQTGKNSRSGNGSR